jgi:DNA-binding FadR family transcriptional regulator
MTFEEALAQIGVAVREHGATVEQLAIRLKSGAISEERFVAEMVSLRKAFERIVGELTLEAKSSALAAMASLKVPESQTRN